jgi:hypothetical protein
MLPESTLRKMGYDETAYWHSARGRGYNIRAGWSNRVGSRRVERGLMLWRRQKQGAVETASRRLRRLSAGADKTSPSPQGDDWL